MTHAQRSLRAMAVALFALFLGSCSGASVTPLASHAAPPARAGERVRFRLTIPPAHKQVRRKHWIRGKYVSPATLGVGIGYVLNGTPANQSRTPQVAFDLATCSSSDGCSSSSGSGGTTTYTLSAQIPAGTYGFDVTTWDASPTGTLPGSGTFPASANALSEGVIPSQAISAGSSGPTLSLTLNAQAAAIAFVPRPDQSHVQTVAQGYAIIGNAPVQFLLNALDADGYTIVGSGAPTVSFSDASGTYQFRCPAASDAICTSIDLSTATSGVANVVNVQAVALDDGNLSPSIALTGSDSGSPSLPVTDSVVLQAIPELWVSFTGGVGTCPCGLFGYALDASNHFALLSTNPVDATLNATGVQNLPVVVDDLGAPWLAVSEGSPPSPFGIDQLSAPAGTVPPQLPSTWTATPTIAPPADPEGYDQFGGIAYDGSKMLWIADSGYSSVGRIYAYDLTTSPPTLTQTVAGGSVSAAFVNFYGIAVAPSSTTVAPGSVWTVAGGGTFVKPAASSTFQAIANSPSGSSIALGPGNLAWICNVTMDLYGVTGTPSTPALGASPTATASANCENEIAVLQAANLPSSTQSIAWMGNGFGNAGLSQYVFNGTSITTTSILPFASPQNANVAGVYATP